MARQRGADDRMASRSKWGSATSSPSAVGRATGSTVLHNSGVEVVVDDLGAAAAATDVDPDALRDWAVELLRHAARVPARPVKLDPRFVRRLESDERLRAVIDAAHASDIAVVALAVEDEEMATRAQRVGFDLAQGFHFARPAAPEPGSTSCLARG